MAITSIFINGEIPVIEGMKTLDDFIVKSFFDNFPATDGIPFAGYYFGSQASDITLNSFNNDVPASLYGNVSNTGGYVAVGINDYIDTNEKAPVALTVAAAFIRPKIPAANNWFVADFSSVGTTGKGFAIGVGANGKLRVAAQVAGESAVSVAEVDFPAAVAEGSLCAMTSFIRQGTITIAVYDPDKQTYVSTAVPLPGTRLAGVDNIFIGRKKDNNTSSETTNVKAVVLINGALTAAQHVAVQQYLLAME